MASERDLATTAPLRAPDDIDTPALLVDLDIVDRNLARMQQRCDAAGIDLLPHAKTHRIPELAVRQIQAGAIGVCLAKLGEAEAFADAGIARITIAYPLVGANKVARAVALAKRIDLTVATDSLVGAREISDGFLAEGMRAKVMLLVDTGLRRCGVDPDDAVDLATELAGMAGLQLAGILTHEGHAYSGADDADVRERSIAAAATMQEVARRIREAGVPLRIVSMGSSASAPHVASATGATELRPGIYAFNDRGQVALGNAEPDDCAARVLATVVSRPDATRGCIDAGSKALSSDRMAVTRDGFDGFGTLVGHPGWAIERLSEEHGWLRWRGDGAPAPLPIGTRVEVVPNHVCTVFSALGEAHALRDGSVEAVWRTVGVGASR